LGNTAAGSGMNTPLSGRKLRVVVDDVLTFLEASEEANARAPKNVTNTKANTKRHALPPQYFDGAVPLGMNADEEQETILYETDKINRADALPIWPLDVCWANWQEMDGGRQMAFHRFRTVKPKEVRGIAKIFSPVMAEHAASVVYENGEKLAAVGVNALIAGNWVDARGTVNCWRDRGGFEQSNLYDDQEREGRHFTPMYATWVGLRQRYDWSVLLGYHGSNRVRLFTDPIGLRAVFKLRDLPEGRERRAALKHWVSAHWRRQRLDDDAKSWVRKHIRGASEFAWEGLRCGIAPAAYDLEQIAKGAA